MPRSSGQRARAASGNATRVLPIVLCATAAGAVLATARFGIGLTPDSVVYITGARALAAGDGYTAGGRAITDFPPGYSAALSLLDRTGIDAITGARGLGVVTFLVTVTLGFLLLRRHAESQGALIAGTVVIGCSAVLLNIYTNALSEHLFVIVVLLFVFAIERTMRDPRSAAVLAAVVLLAWAAFYLRYIGIVLAVVGGLVLMIGEWNRGRLQAVLRACLLTGAGLAAPALWMLRNHNTGSGVFGPRAPASSSPMTNLTRVREEVSEWVVTDRAPVALGTVVMAIVLAVTVAFLIRNRARLTPPSHWRSMIPLGLLVSAYVGYLVASASLVAFAAINTRLMIPVFVPLVVLVVWFYEYMVANIRTDSARRALALLATGWIVLNVVWFAARAVRLAHDGAGGYSTAQYHDSKILRDVEELDASAPIFSNDAPAISLFAERHATASVVKTHFGSKQRTGSLPSFVHQVACAGRVKLVWLLPNPRPYLYEPRELAQTLRLVPVVRRSDGVIYDVAPRADTPPCRPTR